MPNKSAKHDDPAQSKRFIEAAKNAGAAETKKSAERAFKNIVAKRPTKAK